MAKKSKKVEYDFDYDALIEHINQINESGLLEDPIEIDDDADTTVYNFINALSDMEESDIDSLPTSADIVEFHNGLPERFFDDDSEGEEGDSDESDEVDGEEGETDKKNDEEEDDLEETTKAREARHKNES